MTALLPAVTNPKEAPLSPRGTPPLARALLLALTTLAGSPQPTHAAELTLHEPAPCVSANDLSFRVERLLGRPLASVEALQLSLRVEPDPNGFTAQLEVQRPDDTEPGVRTLRASSCAELEEALAIAIVVAIGDGKSPETSTDDAPSPAPEMDPAPEPVNTPDTPSPDAPAPAPQSVAPKLTAAAWAIADSGSLPASALGAALGVGLSWRSLELRAMGTFLPEREGKLIAADPRSPGVSIGLLAGGAVGCLPVALQSSSLGMAVCAGAELGQLSGSGTRVTQPYQRRALWAAARVELATRLALGQTPLALELLATALAPITRDQFILKDLGEIHRPASVIGRLGLGLTLTAN